VGQLTDPYKDAESEGLGISLSGLPDEPEEPPPDDDIDVDFRELGATEDDVVPDDAVAEDDAGAAAGESGDRDADGDTDGGDDDGDDAGDESTGEVAYDLSEWDDDLVEALDEALDGAGVAYAWDDEELELYVREADEGLVDAILDEVQHPHALPEESDDGDAGAALLGELFVVADELQHDPEEHEAVARLLRLAMATEDADLPYGLAEEDWEALRGRVDALAEALEVDEPDGDAVIEAAVQLRNAIRPYV
jgi:hypothetical protein